MSDKSRKLKTKTPVSQEKKYFSQSSFPFDFKKPRKLENIFSFRLANDIAVVRVYFGSPFLTKMKEDVRFTFAGKVSNIGEERTSSISLIDS